MALKMKAAVVERFGKPLTLQGMGRTKCWGGANPGQNRGLRRMPHRSPRCPWRLAGEARPSVHSGPCRRSGWSRPLDQA